MIVVSHMFSMEILSVPQSIGPCFNFRLRFEVFLKCIDLALPAARDAQITRNRVKDEVAVFGTAGTRPKAREQLHVHITEGNVAALIRFHVIFLQPLSKTSQYIYFFM